MASVTYDGKQTVNLSRGLFTDQQWRTIGEGGIQAVQERLDKALDVNDQPAAPYSERGPIYVPNFGVGTGVIGAVRGHYEKRENGSRSFVRHASAGNLVSRTKTNLGGVFGFTSSDRGALRKRGIASSNTAKTTKFKNYGEMKRAIGKTGKRDLELSGKMRASITVVEVGPDHVSVGFSSEEQAVKMAGNIKRCDQWGFSPNDQTRINALVETFFDQQLQQSF